MKVVLSLCVSGVVLWASSVRAEPQPAAEPKQPKPSEKRPASVPGQELEEPVTPLVPTRPRTVAEEARLEGLSWFASGQVLQKRNDRQGAFNAYMKAVERDPTAIAVYRVLIPLAQELKQFNVAIDLARKAIELDPTDYRLMIETAEALMNRQDIAGAIPLLEQASRAPGLDKNSPPYVLLMSQMGVLYMAAGRKNDAATSFEVVFDSLVNPEKYRLDFRARAALARLPGMKFEELAEVFLDAGKTDLALAAFQKAGEKAGANNRGKLSYNLARVYVQADQPEKALEELQKYIDGQRQTERRAAYELLAVALKKAGKSDELIPRLEAAAQKDPHNSALQFYLADQYAAADRLADAETLYKKTLEEASEAVGYLGLATIYRRQNRPGELLSSLAKAFADTDDLKELAPEIKAIVKDEKLLDALIAQGEKLLAEQPPRLDFPQGYVLANIATDAKRTAVAEKLYRYLLATQADKAPQLHEELGSHLLEVRKYADAIKEFEDGLQAAALSDVPMRLQLSVMLTMAKELSGDTKGALETIAAAHQIVPGENPRISAMLQFRESWVYAHSHQFDEAIRRLEQLIADFGGLPEMRSLIRQAQFTLSNTLVTKGDLRRGEEILEGYYQQNPDDVSVNNDLGYLYADQGKNLEQAHSMIKKALDSEPENAAYLDSMGWVLFKLGKHDEALPYLEKAVKISTGMGDETLWDHLGDVYDRLKQPTKAADAWKKSLENAREASYPDRKLIDRVEEKLKNLQQDPGKLKTQRQGAP